MITGRPLELSARLRLRLFVEALGGVLPKASAEVDRPVRLRLTTGDGYRGEIDFGQAGGRMPTAHLHFWSDDAAARMFARRWFIPPLPMGGWNGLLRLGGFAAGMERLGKVLEDRETLDPAALRWQLEAGLRAALPVSEEDPVGRELIAGAPEGVIRFHLMETALGPGLRVEGGRLRFDETAGRGDAEVVFGSETVLRAGLNGTLDTLAAVGDGRVVVDGLIPFADRVSLLLDRAGECLRLLA
ncbi:MAG: hypothetical protein OHK005_19210 [Candidatus Methylacidiphilales bacterium]